MKKVTLFIASSLDGFIARKNGDVDWLLTDQDYGYTDFLAGIDTLLMGGVTYRQVLSFSEEWPYRTKNSIVFTHDVSLTSNEEVTFVHGDIKAQVKRLKEEKGKGIWLVGGAEINTTLLNAGLIDEIWIFQMPVILGAGVPLFKELSADHWFVIHDIEEFDTGLVKMIYHRKQSS